VNGLDVKPTYGHVIRNQRKAAKMTQQELANKAGIAVNSLKRYESGERQPTMGTLEDIAAALGLPLGDFFWKDNREGREFFWLTDLDEMLKHVGCSVGYYHEDSVLWINYPEGTLEVSEKDLIDLNESVNAFLRFQLQELRARRQDDFRAKR
jgi:transcriptional regulator with XRE-family HTH domain